MTRRSVITMLAALFGSGAAPAATARAAEADPGLDVFLKAFPPDADVNPCDEATCQAYAGKLPDILLRLWREVGLGSYAGGLLVITDPAHWEPTLSAWLRGNIQDRYTIARSAFGDLFYYRDKGMHEVGGVPMKIEDVSRIDPHNPHSDVCAWSLEAFLGEYLLEPETPEAALRKPLFDAAVARLGRPKGDNGFFFVPALALGGPADIAHVGTGDLIVHLHILVQMHQ